MGQLAHCKISKQMINKDFWLGILLGCIFGYVFGICVMLEYSKSLQTQIDSNEKQLNVCLEHIKHN